MKAQKKVPAAHLATNDKTLPKTAAPGVAKWLTHPATHLALILITGLIAYSNSFTVPFVWDDDSIISTAIVTNLFRFLSGEGYALYPRRFIGFLTFSLNYHFGGTNVVGYHVVNLTIHIMTACLVYVLARITFKVPFFAHRAPISQSATIFIPLFAALLFVAHPIQTQAVTYIVQRLASLATFFYLAAVISYVKARLVMVERDQRLTVTSEEIVTGKNTAFLSWRMLGWFGLALACALLAMHTKEIAATLPLVILTYEFFFFGASDRKNRLLLIAPILMILVIFISPVLFGKPMSDILSAVDQQTRLQTMMPRSDYLLTQFSVIATYLRLLVLPINQNIDYDYPVFSSFLTPPVMVGFLLISALLSLAVWLYRKSDTQALNSGQPPSTVHLYRLIAFGIFWFFITLLVESSFIPIIDVIFEHRLYLPTIGIFIAVAAGGALLLKRLPSFMYGWIIAAAIILIFTGATHMRNRVWQTSISLWTDVTAKSPNKDRTHDNLGQVLSEQGLLEEAAAEFKTAIMLNPDNHFSHYNLASCLALMTRPDEAIPHFLRALQLNPTMDTAENNLALAYLGIQEVDNAIVHFRQAVKINPNGVNFRNNLGSILHAKGLLGEAIQHLQKAVELAPDYAKAQHNLGKALLAAGNIPQGKFHLQEAVRLEPDNERYKEAVTRSGLN